jgi:hypothetical protein
MQKFTPIIVDAPQLSPRWFESRLGNVTGSRVSDTRDYYKPTAPMLNLAIEIHEQQGIDLDYIAEMGEKYPAEFCVEVGIELQEASGRMNYRREIVTERITGMSANLDQYITKDMQWGQQQEPAARALYGLVSGNRVETAPLFLHPELLTGASPDGLVIDIETGELGNLECKCLKSTNHLYKVIKQDAVPDDYHDQIQDQMWINGRDWCDFVAYDSRVKEGLHLFIKRVDRDDFFINNVLEPSIRRFLAECDRDERQFYAIMNARNEAAKRKLKEQTT